MFGLAEVELIAFQKNLSLLVLLFFATEIHCLSQLSLNQFIEIDHRLYIFSLYSMTWVSVPYFFPVL